MRMNGRCRYRGSWTPKRAIAILGVSIAEQADTDLYQAGEPVYVHLDVRSASLIDLKVDQDAWIYHAPID